MERSVTAGDLRMGAFLEREAEYKRDRERRELVASVLDQSYPKVADKIRAGMRSSTWPENLVDPGLLLDLLEKLDF